MFAENIGKRVRKRSMCVREQAGELVTERLGCRKKMDLCNLSLCVKYNLHIACIICFLLGQEYTEIRGDILRVLSVPVMCVTVPLGLVSCASP